jgi:alkanesulfonate monooxygenase SsuD/methylene tetrahydromethanopterin reductase-like flavin-dependent oxidoreductase (luciferase family)
MVEAGRDPDSCKILFIVSPVLGETTADARAKNDRVLAGMKADISSNLAGMSYASGVDFSTFDLDAPFPDLTNTNATRSSMAMMTANSAGMTLRQAAEADPRRSVELIGTPDAVAAQMGEIVEEIGGDGFLISGNVNRRYIAEITEGLVPELRKRGLVRDGYTHEQFRDNLLEF